MFKFINHKKYSKKIDNIKLEFNELQIFDSNNKLPFLEALSKTNEHFKNKLDAIIASKNNFSIQLKIVKEKIILLSFLHSNFNNKSVTNLISEIKNDLIIMEGFKAELLNSIFPKDDFLVNINTILVLIRKETDVIQNFYSENIEIKNNINKSIFRNYILTIKEKLLSLNDITTFPKTELLERLFNLSQDLEKLMY
jgi:hypothetical protein